MRILRSSQTTFFYNMASQNDLFLRVSEIKELLLKGTTTKELWRICEEKYKAKPRTVDSWIKKAKNQLIERNEKVVEQLDKQRTAQVLTADANAISSKLEDLEILTSIARGNKFTQVTIIEGRQFEVDYIPSPDSRIKALTLKAQMEGNMAPVKQDIRLAIIPVLKSEIVELPEEMRGIYKMPPIEDQQKLLANE